MNLAVCAFCLPSSGPGASDPSFSPEVRKDSQGLLLEVIFSLETCKVAQGLRSALGAHVSSVLLAGCSPFPDLPASFLALNLMS